MKQMKITVYFAHQWMTPREYIVDEDQAKKLAAGAQSMLEEWLMIPSQPQDRKIIAIRIDHVVMMEVTEHYPDPGIP